jgi:hypothetical protein
MAKTKTAAKPKAPSKAVAKKSTVTKPKGIPRAPEHHHFVLVDGRRFGDIKELADALEDMADLTWNHHVNDTKNDFANWIHDVFSETELAARIRAASGKHHAQIVLYRTILERI